MTRLLRHLVSRKINTNIEHKKRIEAETFHLWTSRFCSSPTHLCHGHLPSLQIQPRLTPSQFHLQIKAFQSETYF